jgi:cell division protein FtsA
MSSEFIVSIDIGSTKVAVLIGELGAEETVRIIGAGHRPCEGMKKGVVVNIEQVAACIREARAEAEKMAGVEIHGVCASVSGSHIRSFNSGGVIAIPMSRREVTRRDIERVTEAARNITLPVDREILHAIPQDFIVDNHRDIRDPVGMSAMRLEAGVHIVTAESMTVENFVKAIRKAGLELINTVFEPLAAARAVLSEEEMEGGCLLIDSGGGVTSFVLYHGGCVRCTGVIAVGGANITNDLAIGLRVPASAAEWIKQEHGVALTALAGEDEAVELPPGRTQGGREIRTQIIASIIEPRCEEIFTMVKRAVSTNPFYRLLGGGVVLTGGGACLSGIGSVAEQVMSMPVRIGRPQGLTGLVEVAGDESFSCGAGLLLYERDSILDGGLTGRDGGRRFGWMIERLKRIASLF